MSPSYHSVQVRRTARIASLGTPATASVWWIVLHGYGQRATDVLPPFDSIAGPERCVIAPEGLSRFYVDSMNSHEDVGASWMTRADRTHEIEDYVRYLDAVVNHFRAEGTRPSLSVRVLGFSQGAATASRWAVLGDTSIDRLVLWGGAPAHDLELDEHGDALRAMDLTLVLGTDDPYVSDQDRATVRRRLDQHDIPVSVQTFDGGHRLDADVVATLVGSAA